MPNNNIMHIIDFNENMDVHCKAYIQPSFDAVIKAFQMKETIEDGVVVTYSEAVRRLLLGGLKCAFGDNIKFVAQMKEAQ